MRATLLLCLPLALLGCNSDTPATATQGGAPAAQAAAAAEPAVAIRGQLNAEVDKLPPGLALRLRLLDTTDPTAGAVVVSEATQPAPSAFPARYVLGYDAARIDPARSYAIDAAVMADTVMLFSTPAPTAVLTQGAGSEPALALARGGQPSLDIPPAERLRKDFEALEASIGGLRRVAGERIDEAVTIGWDAFFDDSGVRVARENVDFGDAGSAAFRYAYHLGQPWVVVREQGGVTTMVGWDKDGTVLINETSDGQTLDDADVQALKARAEVLLKATAGR